MDISEETLFLFFSMEKVYFITFISKFQQCLKVRFGQNTNLFITLLPNNGNCMKTNLQSNTFPRNPYAIFSQIHNIWCEKVLAVPGWPKMGPINFGCLWLSEIGGYKN